MLKKGMGFTLIELLAVIVILAIIALIAVPIVINIINDSKKESLQRSIDLYIDTAEKAITKYQMIHPGFKPDKCEIQSNGNLMCGETEIEVEVKGQVPESGTITIVDNKVTYDVELEGMEYILNSEGIKNTQPAPSPATGTDYKGYYADVDGDGEADGVIYADLAQSSEAEAQYTNSNGVYSYTAKTNLNEYTISQNKHSGKFGEKEIIKLKKDKGNPRFYVMALEDFRTGSFETGNSQGYTEGTYFWYYNAIDQSNWTGRMSTYATDTSVNFGTGYANTGKIIEIWNKNGEGTGSYTGATKDDHDIFKHIQDKYNSKEKWYIPSRGEWAAFADYFTNKTDLETKLTTSNYNSLYRLSGYYWSSSQGNAGYAWSVYFSSGYMNSDIVYSDLYVRLGATF